MPNKGFLIALGLGGAVVAVLIGLVVLKQQGSTPRLAGAITNVRTLGMDESSSVAIVDFRFVNESRLRFIVQSTGMTLVDSKGETREGQIIAAADTNELFKLFPAIGAKAGETLIIKNRIEPKESRQVMLAARFEIPKTELDSRKSITISVLEVDGAVSELSR